MQQELVVSAHGSRAGHCQGCQGVLWHAEHHCARPTAPAHSWVGLHPLAPASLLHSSFPVPSLGLCACPCLSHQASSGGASEQIRLRVLARVTHGVTTSVRLELSHDHNLFFYYQHTMTPAVFGQVQVSQQLMVGFDNYPAMLARLVDQVRVCVYNWGG